MASGGSGRPKAGIEAITPYRIVIPGTIGGMLLFVSTDFARRRIERARERRAARAAAAQAVEAPPPPDASPAATEPDKKEP